MLMLPVGILLVLIYSVARTIKLVNSMREENFKLKINKDNGIKNILSINMQNRYSMQMFFFSIISFVSVIYVLYELLGGNPNVQESKEQLLSMVLVMLGLSVITISSVVRNTYKGLVEFGITEDEIMLHGDTYKLEHFRSYKWNRERLFIELERNYKNVRGSNSEGNIQYEVFVPRSKRSRTEEVLERMSTSAVY